jgi:NADH-quinone oxidoreductase subunit N
MDALIVVFVSGLISLFAAFAKKPAIVVTTALLGLLGSIGLIINTLRTGETFFELVKYEGLQFDPYALIFSLSIAILAFLVIGIGYDRFKDDPNHTGDYIGLLLFSTTGAMIMTAYTDMFMFFLGLEILSIPIYVMAGSNKKDLRSSESALKYFLMGSFATGIFLFGVAWVYGATGSFKLQEIYMRIQEMEGMNKMLLVGILFILVSFIFKIGAAPFHFWGPDVYQGAPTPVTAFMASVVKTAALFALVKMFALAFGTGAIMSFWMNIVIGVIIASMFIGNLSALRQVSLKRLMAYSSITHVGYTLLVLVSASMTLISDLWFYMLGYGLSVIGILAVGMAVNDEEDRITALRGLGKRNPFLALVGVVSILSLAGIPITAGFFGKYMVFSSAWMNASWLVIIALINSAISIYYYLKVLINIVSPSDEEQPKVTMSILAYCMLGIVLVGILGLGFIIPFLY